MKKKRDQVSRSGFVLAISSRSSQGAYCVGHGLAIIALRMIHAEWNIGVEYKEVLHT
jgi:hypothetical protein